MLAVSEDKQSIHLKESVLKRTRNHVVEPRSRRLDQGMSAIQESELICVLDETDDLLVPHYEKQSKDKFAWYAAVDYDMDADSIATQWKILPERIVPAVIVGWQLTIINENRLKLEPIPQHTEGSSQDQPSAQHLLTLLYWMPIPHIDQIFKHKCQCNKVQSTAPELLQISEY